MLLCAGLCACGTTVPEPAPPILGPETPSCERFIPPFPEAPSLRGVQVHSVSETAGRVLATLELSALRALLADYVAIAAWRREVEVWRANLPDTWTPRPPAAAPDQDKPQEPTP
jgi:hypothetical protein